MGGGWDGRKGIAEPQNVNVVPMEQGAPRERFVGAGSEPIYYANSAQVVRSNHDVRLQFGVVQSAIPGEVTTRVMAGVYMSEAHARALLELLTKVLAS